MSGSLAQLGMGVETVYGTPVAVDKFYEFVSEDIVGRYIRVQAEALSASLVDRGDRYALAPKGAAGNVVFEPLTRDFGYWLPFMLGDAVTVEEASGVYRTTATMANLFGKSFTVQIGRPRQDSVIEPWTYAGGKITSFEFSNQVDQTLRVSLSMDFASEASPQSPTGPYALQTPAYQPYGEAQVFTWQGGQLKIDDQVLDIGEVTIGVDNALNVERYFINSAASTKREPVQDGKRQITWSFRAPYEDRDLWRRVAAATREGAQAVLEARWTGLVPISGSIYPSLLIRIPCARFDEGGPRVEGPSLLEVTYSGVGLDDTSGSPLTIEVVSDQEITPAAED